MPTGRSGIFTQLGVAEETTYGTYVAPARFLEFTEETLALNIDRNEAKGLRSAQRVLGTDHWQAGKRAAAGDLTLEVANKGFGLIFKHLLGGIATGSDGTGKKHTATIAELFGLSLSAQIGRPDVSGTVQPFSYMGSKVSAWELNQDLDAFALLKLTLDAQDEATSNGLASASAPAETELFHWSGFSMTVAGSAFDAIKFGVKGNNNVKTDRHFLKASKLKKEPIEHAKRDYTGTLQGEFESLTAYNRFINGTVVPIVCTWTAVATYDTAKPFKLVLTMNNCRFDGKTPNVKGEDVIDQELPFKCLDDYSAQVIQFDYYTNDTTP